MLGNTMIEAVNSVLSNVALTRVTAEQQSALRSFAANPERVQEIAKAPYISPYISMDVHYDRAVLQIRDSDTGDVVRQFPSESQLEAYRRAQNAKSAEGTAAESVAPRPDVQPENVSSTRSNTVATVPDIQPQQAPSAPAAQPAQAAVSGVNVQA